MAPEREPLRVEVEVDETLVGGRHSARSGGRQRAAKALVGIAVEVRGQGSGRLRLGLLPDATKPSLAAFVAASGAKGAVVHSDGWTGHWGLPRLGYEHRPIKQRRRFPDERKLLPRAHRASSNLKTWLQGTHRGVERHLQVYLDEFVFRHNRRRTPMAGFQTLLGLGAHHGPTTYHEITGQQAAA